ncbi:MAG: T9SS type A sorting domain-containing protein [Chitinophagaceae bacterium]|nr:T9SS type A sorting domain-containing protein [Chitinophagaceae bacterium]
MNLYPNPVKDDLTLKFKGVTNENISIQISDLSGRRIISQQVSANNTVQTVNINTANLSAQVYILKMINSKNETIAIQKFVKQ